MFSGGIDSMQVLRAFVDNNIPIDEVCSHHEYGGTKDRNAYGVGEVYYSALPYVQKLINEKLLTTKYRLVDSSEAQIETLRNISVDSRDKSYYNFNAMQNIGTITDKWNIRYYVDDYKKIMESGKKLCLVYGEGKPIIEFDKTKNKHKFCFKNRTVPDMICPPQQQEENHPAYFDEMFYFGYPNISIKQGHVLLRYLKNYTMYPDKFFDATKVSSRVAIKLSKHVAPMYITNPLISHVSTFCQDAHIMMKRSFMHDIIYPGIEPPIYDHGKNSNKIFNPRDQWLVNAESAQTRKWYTGLLKTASKLNHRIYNNKNLDSTEYFIE
jgi:hypothetical protein